MNCEEIENLLPAYALDALDPEEALEVERHLENCPWCSALAREQREVAAYLALGASPSSPAPRILQRIMRAVSPVPEQRDPQRRPVSFLGALAYASATVAVLLLGGILAFTLRTSSRMDGLQDTNLALKEQVASLQRENLGTSNKVDELKATNLGLTEEVMQMQEDNDSLSQELVVLQDGSNRVAQQITELNEDTPLVVQVAAQVNRLKEGNDAVTAEVSELRNLSQDLSEGSKYLAEQMNNLTASGEEFLDVMRMQQSIIYMLTLPDTSVLSLTATELDPEAQGSLMINGQSNQGVFVAAGLATLPSFRSYQIWLSRGDEQVESQGLLSIDDNGWGIVVFQPDHAIESYVGVMVTVELAGGSSTPSTERVVLSGDIEIPNPPMP